MNINIVCTSKPVDGLLYYSYEYCALLNAAGIKTKVIIICHRKFNKEDYLNALTQKYINCENVFFDDFIPDTNDITLIMGRSMLTLSWIDFKLYSQPQKNTLKSVFSKNIIAVYSENHPSQYPKAVEFYSPTNIVDLCDIEIYPNGVGKNFEKRINFDIYKPFTTDIKFKYLFLGTNDKYYATAEKLIENFSDYRILTYNADYINNKNKHVFAPVPNLLGIFDTYVYAKETFDPAPRLIQECKFYNKNIIYQRPLELTDGGSVYWKRNIKIPDIDPILEAIDLINNY